MEEITKLLFSFKGRIGRRPFWIVTLIILGFSAGIKHILGPFGANNPMTVGPAVITLSWFVLAVWVTLAVQVKRWHDLGKSGLWAIVNLVPVLGPIWVIIQCGFMPGTKGKNLYGSVQNY